MCVCVYIYIYIYKKVPVEEHFSWKSIHNVGETRDGCNIFDISVCILSSFEPQNVIQTSYKCLLLNGITVIFAAQTENACLVSNTRSETP